MATTKNGRMFETDVAATNCPDWYSVLQCQGIEWSEIEFASVASEKYLACLVKAATVNYDALKGRDADTTSDGAGGDLDSAEPTPPFIPPVGP